MATNLLRATLAAVASLLTVGAEVASAHTCGTTADCTMLRGTTCMATCNEADFRAAVHVLNQCYPQGTPPAPGQGPNRTLKFDTGGCASGCLFPLNLTTFGAASCGTSANDPAGAYNAICVTADHVTIDGVAPNGSPGVIFRYTGPYPCASCSGTCQGPQPALFLLQGTGIRIQNVLGYAFFPEGIQIRKRANGTGAINNVISTVSSLEHYCEDAITINGGSGNQIAASTFFGHTDPCPSGGTCLGTCWRERKTTVQFGSVPAPCAANSDCGGQCSISFRNCTDSNPCPQMPQNEGSCGPTIPQQLCHCNATGLFAGAMNCGGPGSGTCYRKALCGLDKAIQINGGNALNIDNNTFINSARGVLVTDGIENAAAFLTGNSVSGSSTAITLSGEPTFSVSAQNVCLGIGADHVANSGNSVTANFNFNTLNFCKFGIESTDGAVVGTFGNTITNAYNSAFRTDGNGGSLTGALNKMKGDMSAGEGRILVESTNATIDFGNPNGQENLFCGTGTDIVTNGDADDATNNCYDSLPPIPNTALTSGAKAVSHADCVARFPNGCNF